MMSSALGRFIGHLSDRRRTMIATIATTTVSFGVFDFLADLAMVEFGVPATEHAATQAAIVGIGAGGAMWLILLGNRDRRMMVADELKRVAELNHTVRNSLEIIGHAHYISGIDEDHNRMMREAVREIDEKLKQLFPVLGVIGRGI